MANKLAGGIKAGGTSYSHTVRLFSINDGLPVTGKVAADLTATYRRQGATRTTITLSDLAALTTAYASGGVKEDLNGEYRIDLPDAMIATGADWVSLHVLVGSTAFCQERIPLETQGAAEVFTLAGTINTAVSALTTAVAALPTAAAITTAVWAAGTRSLTTFGTLVADVTAAVWSATTRGLNAVGNIVSGLLDEAIAGHLTAGTVGKKINDAASAGDPWATALPGSYGAGTAGATLSALGGDSADIDTILAKVAPLTYAGSLVQATGGDSAAVIAAAVAAIIVETEGNISLKQAICEILAGTMGPTTNDGKTILSPNGNAPRAVGTFGPTGERESVVLTPSS